MAQIGKNLPAMPETPVQSLGQVGKVPWRRKWLPTPVFLPGKFHGERVLAGYSPWGSREPDMTERLTMVFFLKFVTFLYCFYSF